MTRVRIARWGDSLAVRLPNDIVEAAHLQDGGIVDIEAVAGTVRLIPTAPSPTVDDWFKGKTEEEWRAEYRTAIVDWGPDVGREIISE